MLQKVKFVRFDDVSNCANFTCALAPARNKGQINEQNVLLIIIM